jgi:hypothetical protein
MSPDCGYCDKSFGTKDKLDTHIMLNHREEAKDDGFEYESEVSDGYLKEQEVETGEQFGY